MSNYKYRIDDDDVILSQEEHDFIQGLLENKEKGLVKLKPNKGINLSFIKFFKETEQPTDDQEIKILALQGEIKNEHDEVKVNMELKKKYHMETYKLMGWDHNQRCVSYCPMKNQ